MTTKTSATKERYLSSIGRRKTATARVRITEASKTTITVNEKPLEEYFRTKSFQHTITDALTKSLLTSKFLITVKVMGSGLSAQAEAVRHGISRALVMYSPDVRKALKKEGYLKRDPRMVERKKFGLKKARKSSQWAKR